MEEYEIEEEMEEEEEEMMKEGGRIERGRGGYKKSRVKEGGGIEERGGGAGESLAEESTKDTMEGTLYGKGKYEENVILIGRG